MATIQCPSCSAIISDEDGFFDCYCCNNIFTVCDEIIQTYGLEGGEKWRTKSTNANADMSAN